MKSISRLILSNLRGLTLILLLFISFIATFKYTYCLNLPMYKSLKILKALD